MPRRLWIFSALVLALAAQPAPADDDTTLMGQPVADYAARRQDLMRRLGEAAGNRHALALVRGSDRSDREDFAEGRFRQNNWFAYLTGVEIPGAYLVLRPEEKQDILYLPPGRLGTAFSGGDRAIPEPGEETAKRWQFAEVASTSRLLGDLFTELADPIRPSFGGGRSAATVYTITPNPREGDASPEAKFIRFLKQGAPTTRFEDLAPMVSDMRTIKSKAELAILQRTIDITGEAERAVMEAIRPGAFEYEMEGALIGEFLKGGSFRPGFASIVGSGPNATIPHYFANDRQMESGDLLVVDIGAEVENYTADITRTFPVNGKFTDRQREIYNLVLDAQEYAMNLMKPGETTLGEMTGHVSAYLRKSELRAKDSRGNEQTMDRFFIHGLGHFLGLDVHDVGDYGKALEAGAVFTIEPGLYIPSENIGVRIEDDYLMTAEGPVKLSKDIPSDPDEIERIIGEARAKSESREKEAVGAGR